MFSLGTVINISTAERRVLDPVEGPEDPEVTGGSAGTPTGSARVTGLTGAESEIQLLEGTLGTPSSVGTPGSTRGSEGGSKDLAQAQHQLQSELQQEELALHRRT